MKTSFNIDEKKFNIKGFIGNQPLSKRKETRKRLISIMRISEKTFERIINAKVSDKQEMSATNLILVSDFFEVHPKELINIPNEIWIGNTRLV